MHGVRFRRFLYLDPEITDAFLAQVEGGLYAEEEQTTRETSARGISGGAAVGPLRAEGSRSGSGEETVSRTVQLVAEGNFARLAAHLERQKASQYLQSFDEGIWNQLRRGEVIELEAELSVPTLFQFAGMAESFGPLLEVIKMAGEEVDPSSEQTLGMMSSLGQLFDRLPLIAVPTGAPTYKFVAPLIPDNLRVDPPSSTEKRHSSRPSIGNSRAERPGAFST